MSIGDRLSVSGTALSNFANFGSLQSVGSMTVFGNEVLVNFTGLEKLTSLTMAAVTSGMTSYNSQINELTISGNSKLSSLNGLQNLANVPVLRILQKYDA